MRYWTAPFLGPVDVVAFALFMLVAPVYHVLYPVLVKRFPDRTAKGRIDRYRRSWIQRVIETRDVATVAQQVRNLTMVNSFLASSALILVGVTGNILVQFSNLNIATIPHPAEWEVHPEAIYGKLYLLILAFAVAFTFFMTSLRHLGHFNMVIGADPRVVEELEGSAVDYFTTLINRASNRHTLGVRCFYYALPLFLWLFDTWFFLALTLFYAIKFIGLQDFAHLVRRPE